MKVMYYHDTPGGRFIGEARAITMKEAEELEAERSAEHAEAEREHEEQLKNPGEYPGSERAEWQTFAKYQAALKLLNWFREGDAATAPQHGDSWAGPSGYDYDPEDNPE